MFNAASHMLTPAVKSSEKGRECILWLQQEMKRRLKEEDDVDEKNYDRMRAKWPSIVCAIDEFSAFIRLFSQRKSNKSQV